jgi:hypothetical protein
MAGIVCACACIPLFCNGAYRCFLSGATTILDVGPTDLFAVTNRSHNFIKLFFRLQESFTFDPTGCRTAVGGWAKTRHGSTAFTSAQAECSSPQAAFRIPHCDFRIRSSVVCHLSSVIFPAERIQGIM